MFERGKLGNSLFVIVVLACFASSAVAQPNFTIGQNFTGSTLGIDSGFAPPDTMGAIGPSHFVELINGRYSVYNKANGTRVQTSTLNAFWTNAGATPSGAFAFDPRVLYDPFSQRWFATSVDNARAANNFLVAVSQTSNPTQGWNAFKIDSDTGNQEWADFPTMGIDSDGLYISANMFSLVGGNSSTSMLVLPKSDLLLGTPTVANRTLFENVNPNSTGFSVQPIVDMDNSGLPLPILSAFNTGAGRLLRADVTGTAASPNYPVNSSLIAVAGLGDPPFARQPGPHDNLDTGDARFSGNVVLQGGSIWGTQGVNRNGRPAIRWFEIRESDNSVLQSGFIEDSSLGFFYPSIAVNDFGHVVIGFSGSSDTQNVSSYAVVGGTTAGTTTFGAPTILKAGASDYEVLVRGVNRWGDYSATTVDPSNQLHFWTTQEWVSGTDVWSTQITEIIVPEPGTLTALAFGGLLALMRKRRRRR
ncbi:MAG: PEP-CTERM sorting domain-containing protein [Armatimonadetes bacterium]|nr:PEP-CTERM sorting domain-containing protein [Armatimonadota bacterium]